MLLFKEILNKDIPVADVCSQIRSNMELASRIQLVYFLFGIALADGRVQNNELDSIHYISQKLGISEADFNSIKSMYIKHTDSDYTILEISKEANDDEVKKAYRKMAVKFHPDKVSHLGEEYQADAKIKFQKVQEAYENIKKSRGIN
jgi:DnaJ like chaperone protein